jgi:hypothetical protein
MPIYCSWFAQLRPEVMAVFLIVPVFLASWLIVTSLDGPLRDTNEGAEERRALLFFATLMMGFWILFQGFFIPAIDFAFGYKYISETASEGRIVALLFPLVLLKYGLPIGLIVLIYVAHVGVLSSRQVVIATLLFCNCKLATLLVQILVGPLRSHQKLYELAMSDFVFVSQLGLIVGLSYIAALAGSFMAGRLESGLERPIS